MAYFPPYIDSAGLHIPLYNDIYQYLLEQYTAIYGQSVSSNISTTDIQSISIFALMINDSFQGAQAVFNGMSPSKAIGAQQDSLYKLNGIARNPATFSNCIVTVTGTGLFEMINRVALDTNGNLWTLPTDFVIPSSGTIDVNAVCQTPGAITAAIGAINIPANPVSDWFTVSNAAAASPGVSIEPDSAFRARQAVSVVLPSHSLVTGTIAALLAVPGVTRVGTVGVENPTGAVDAFGNPPHSISMVVENGDPLAVATAIYINKTPGGYTNGTTVVNVADPVTGTIMPIRFFRPSGQEMRVAMTVKAFGGYTTSTTAAIQTAIVNYLNSLQISEEVSVSAITAVAMYVNPNLSNLMFSVTSNQICLLGGTLGTADILLGFNQVAQGLASNVAITVT